MFFIYLFFLCVNNISHFNECYPPSPTGPIVLPLLTLIVKVSSRKMYDPECWMWVSRFMM